jgi:hypothetical protein
MPTFKLKIGENRQKYTTLAPAILPTDHTAPVINFGTIFLDGMLFSAEK